MNYDLMTLKLKEILQNASNLAQQKNHSEIGTEHLLDAMLKQKDGIVLPLLTRIGIQPKSLQEKLEPLLDSFPVVTGQTRLILSNEAQNVFDKAEKEMAVFKDQFLSVEHVFLAMIQNKDKVSDLLKNAGCDRKSVLEALKSIRGDSSVDNDNPEGKMLALEKYCIDLTARARLDKIDPVIGRDEEIRRVMQVISRRTKNNPVLIGEPGVGKTAVVEGIARRIANGDVPESLKNKRLLSLDMGSLIVGASYGGVFEERLNIFIYEVL